VDLAGLDGEVYVTIRDHAGEPFGYPAKLDLQ
jgi:hypothetical protein